MVNFLFYKYYVKKCRPGGLMEDTMLRSQSLINTINDETSGEIFIEKGKAGMDEIDVLEQESIITFKQIESILARNKFDKDFLPEELLKAKNANYEKVPTDNRRR